MKSKLHNAIANSLYHLKYAWDYLIGPTRIKIGTSSKRIFFLGTPDHGNLGDHAIALSTIQFLEDYFPEYQIVEVRIDEINLYKRIIKKEIQKEDFFVITGGGNLGSEYLEDEKIRRWVGIHFPLNPMVIMPQTIYFSKTKKGIKELNRSKKAYNNLNTMVITREKVSFELASLNFDKATCFLAPDIVFYYKTEQKCSVQRNKICLCVRNDREASNKRLSLDSIKGAIPNDEIVDTLSTVKDYRISISDRKKEVEEFIKTIGNYKLVITDRLHGMIFSYISETPCVVIPNYNHKIESSFEWIKDDEYVSLLIDVGQIPTIIINKLNLQAPHKTIDFSSRFEDLAKRIRGFIQ